MLILIPLIASTIAALALLGDADRLPPVSKAAALILALGGAAAVGIITPVLWFS
jgi:hypothetical protein